MNKTKKNKKQFPCGTCGNDTSKTKSVLCRGMCGKWHHLKCTDLTLEEFEKIYKSKVKWFCSKCFSADVTKYQEEETDSVNSDLTLELESQTEIIRTLNKDLSQAYEEIRKLKTHTVQLETLVIQKEENIILLEKKVSELNSIIKKPVWSKTLHCNEENFHLSFPGLHSTPVSSNSVRINRTWSNEKNQDNNFVCIKGKKGEV